MNIGAIAERSGISPKTIRYYESIGLIPLVGRRTNGYRVYDEVDMRMLNFVKRARSMGFSLEEVRDLLDLWRDQARTSAAVRSLALRHIHDLDRKIDEFTAMRNILAQLVERCQGDDRPDCPILDELAEGHEV